MTDQTYHQSLIPSEKTILFGEVIQGCNNSVRVTADNLLYAVDLALVMTGKNRNDAAQTLRRIPDNIFPSSKFISRPTTGGGHSTKLISFNDAIELIMVLPGKKSRSLRKQFKDIILRYLDGDRSICSDVLKNRSLGQIKSYSKFASRLIDNDTNNENHENPQTKYVYAAKSSAFPGLLKIGKTENIKQRLSGLKTACAPAPYVIVAMAPSLDHSRDEKIAHEFFSNKRRAGEFFEVDETEVIAFFATHITAKYNVELIQTITRMRRQ